MVIFGFLVGCFPASKNIEKPTPLPVEKNGNIIHPESLSICMYKVNPFFQTKGCTIEGPVQGELRGTVLADDMDLEDALSFCVTHPDCSGITTPFNAGLPFQAIKATEKFHPSDASYACSVLVYGCPK